MNLESIVTVASSSYRLRFLAMERSLRATGCDLPLKVIPFDDSRFSLPANSSWWEMPEVSTWLTERRAHPFLRRYQCLLTANVHYVDSDIIFLRNPAIELAPHSGFVVCCGQWRNVTHATTPVVESYLRTKSLLWQYLVFNAGQFACDRALYTFEQLQAVCESAEWSETILGNRFHDQPGTNLLVNLSGVQITNLTLPPIRLQSSWAGDYRSEADLKWLKGNHAPYLLHWAGIPRDTQLPVDKLLLQFFSQSERQEWDSGLRDSRQRRRGLSNVAFSALRRLVGAARAGLSALRAE